MEYVWIFLMEQQQQQRWWLLGKKICFELLTPRVYLHRWIVSNGISCVTFSFAPAQFSRAIKKTTRRLKSEPRRAFNCANAKHILFARECAPLFALFLLSKSFTRQQQQHRSKNSLTQRDCIAMGIFYVPCMLIVWFSQYCCKYILHVALAHLRRNKKENENHHRALELRCLVCEVVGVCVCAFETSSAFGCFLCASAAHWHWMAILYFIWLHFFISLTPINHACAI